jgi:hypothetical protein
MSSEQTDELPTEVSVEDFRQLVEVVSGLVGFRDAALDQFKLVIEAANANGNDAEKAINHLQDWAAEAQERINALTGAVNLLNLRLNTDDENPMVESTNGSAT